MTKEEIINRLDCCIGRKADCKNCPMNGEDLCAEKLYRETIRLLKENEPASAGTDTSSTNKNIIQLNNSTESIICQALKLAKIAAETGAEITYSDGVFVIKPKVRSDNNVIFD